MSYYLSAMGREHVILERAGVAEAWRTQRWDSLCFQSPNWSMELPGHAYSGTAPDGFAHRDDVLAFIEDYGRKIAAPVRTRVNVNGLRRAAGKEAYELVTSVGRITARNVVVATGPYQRPRLSSYARQIPTSIEQMHTSLYRRPDLLPIGNILVIGSGASGCQIAEDLLDAGRRLYLSVSAHSRAPRRYRGTDVFAWRKLLGQLDQTRTTVSESARTGPLITGASGGRDIDLRGLMTRGVTLLGRATALVDGNLVLAGDLEENLRLGDDSFDAFTRAVDAYIESSGLAAGGGSVRTATGPHKYWPKLPAMERLNLSAEKIGCVIWATGYARSFDWIAAPTFTARGEPTHQRGVSAVPGLYFLGLPWLHKAKSSFLCGVGEDAEFLAEHIQHRRRKSSAESQQINSSFAISAGQ